MNFLLLYIYLTLGFSSSAVLFLRFRKSRSERIASSSRTWERLPIFGLFASFLYALWDASPDNVILGFYSTFFHRLASSLASLAFIVLLMHSFKLFHVNRPRYTHFSLLLAGFCLLILMTTPLQQLAAQFNEDFADSPFRDPSSSSDLGRELKVDTDWQPELPKAFYTGSTLKVMPETQQFINEIPQEELAKALQEIDKRIAPAHISELRQKGKVGYTNKNLDPDWQTSLHDEASKRHPGDPAFKLPSTLTVIFETARWGSIVVKAILVAISLNLKRISLETQSVNFRLASWLVLGTVIVLLQEPFLVNTCLTFTGRGAHITRRIHAILDPIFFTLMYECITKIGYWQHEDNSEEAEDRGIYGSSVLGRILGLREDVTMGLVNLFENRQR